ncbi:peptidylprolyl isomerase [Marinicella gelatinilytica]|uniref:peptidylprolyl isomerase n=1 Tax=Marinicella gelatinilytica TaxID=2996017 RepID=UPI002260D530|nr:peptidylprolyl isomerase [Marinicella gelatinilytica]MCX7545698.1 peptidylprolyl isomerase [Marinicella gelatinilytica]
MKKFIYLLLFISPLATAEQLLDEIVAVVDDSVIMRSELERSANSIKKQIEASGNPAPPDSILNKQVLEKLIVQKVQLQKAEQVGIRISDAEVDAALTNIARQNGISLVQMRETIEADGFNFADFRDDMRKDMITERVRYAYANSTVKISDNEIDLFLADNELDQGEVDIQHILIAIPEGADEATVEAKRAVINDLREQLIAGADFAVIATQYSDGQKALEGGHLGWRPINQLPPIFAEQAKSLSVGEITRPLRSASGFHLVKLIDQRDQTTKMVDQYKVQHLMVASDEITSPKDGMKIINDLYQQLQDGAEFAAIAEEHSDDYDSAPLGGDMGWRVPEELGDRMGGIIKNLDINEMSSPFQTEAGWHVVKLLDKKQADVTEAYKRQQAEQAIRQRKVQQTIDTWVREIRGEAFVDIRI